MARGAGGKGGGRGGKYGGGRGGRGRGRRDDFARMDLDGDGIISPEEYKFAQMDLDGDGVITAEEFRAHQAGARRHGHGGGGFGGGGSPHPAKPAVGAHMGGAGGGAGGAAGGLGMAAAGAMMGAAAAHMGGMGGGGAAGRPGGHGHGYGPVGHGGGGPPSVQALRNVSCIQVQEQMSMIEAGAAALLGAEVEMPNTYAIVDAATRRQLFYAQENTGFIMRQVKQCFGECAPWDLHIMQTGFGGAQPAIHIDRPCSLTCCCFNRPMAGVYDVLSRQQLGSITDPCTCLSTAFHVKDAYGTEVYTADGGCCQPGLWCPCPVGPCAQVDFDINDRRSGKKVGHIRKQLPGLLSWLMAPDVDNYMVDFGHVRDPTHKALLMSLAIYMDFRYWNDSTRDNKDYGLPFLGVDRYGTDREMS